MSFNDKKNLSTAERTMHRARSFTILSESDIEKLMTAIAKDGNRDLKALVTIVLSTGLRLGELRELRWASVNFDDRYIAVAGSRTGDRRVPLDDVVAAVLNSQRGDASPSTLVFDNPGMVDALAVKLSRVSTAALGRRVNFYELRRSFFFRLVYGGTSPAAVMAIAGWSSMLSLSPYLKAVGGPLVKVSSTEIIDK